MSAERCDCDDEPGAARFFNDADPECGTCWTADADIYWWEQCYLEIAVEDDSLASSDPLINAMEDALMMWIFPGEPIYAFGGPTSYKVEQLCNPTSENCNGDVVVWVVEDKDNPGVPPWVSDTIDWDSSVWKAKTQPWFYPSLHRFALMCILINEDDFNFASACPHSYNNINQVLGHEAGHALGLQHQKRSGQLNPDCNSIMDAGTDFSGACDIDQCGANACDRFPNPVDRFALTCLCGGEATKFVSRPVAYVTENGMEIVTRFREPPARAATVALVRIREGVEKTVVATAIVGDVRNRLWTVIDNEGRAGDVYRVEVARPGGSPLQTE